jgi:hypothetical protein
LFIYPSNSARLKAKQMRTYAFSGRGVAEVGGKGGFGLGTNGFRYRCDCGGGGFLWEIGGRR